MNKLLRNPDGGYLCPECYTPIDDGFDKRLIAVARAAKQVRELLVEEGKGHFPLEIALDALPQRVLESEEA